MVRQYKIHTNLDGTDDKVWDVTNGKVRFYQPSNLGLQSTNNIWQSNGIGVMGTRSINQPQIEFKLETFGESLEENYQLMKDFINDILSKKFVTLEYQTEIFQVYADLALADITKTEGYGKNGTFSEKITFDIITKWYTYENLTFDMIQNGKVLSGKSKIYGGYKGSETALQNYNRLKASPSLNLPNLNLIEGTKDFSGHWERAEAWTNDGTYKGLAVKKRTGQWQGIYKVFTAPKSGVYTFSAYIKSLGAKADITRYVFVNDSPVPAVPEKVMGNDFDWLRDSVSVTLKAGDKVSAKYDIAGAGSDSILWNAGHKWEEGSVATPYMQSATEITTADISEYFGYNYIANQAYTYYGETNIDRLSRWDIKDEIFSFMGILYPQLTKTPTGVRFLDDIGNEYTAIAFKTEELQDYILINTDVNDETYQGWKGTTALNLFPVMDFERYRTRIIEKGQMQLINLSKAEFKIKRKAEFV
ncbi:distal tail protein [Lactococcus phage 05601]|uniref:Distal tail protein n=1 Tax=Lactococcus phage 05601 TaxID=2029658 RepID=A0A343JNI4_9CAUD|nr:tail protein [Lactococcus phage 05601]ASZ71057.1 distal tail protein [Lactococcus phage 05601]